VRDQAEKARKKRNFPLSAKWLALLKTGAAFDAETKYAFAVSELKSHKHNLAAPIRRHDAALELMRELLRASFPAIERLRKERALSPEDLFYVAFNFAEGSPQERDLAREMMEHLASKYGRTKVGAAKNKLKLNRAWAARFVRQTDSGRIQPHRKAGDVHVSVRERVARPIRRPVAAAIASAASV
jgi:hypothetical protein